MSSADTIDNTHSKVAAAVKVRSVRAVALTLGIAPSVLTSYVAGVSREGTKLLVASRVDRLDALLTATPAPRTFQRPTAA